MPVCNSNVSCFAGSFLLAGGCKSSTSVVDTRYVRTRYQVPGICFVFAQETSPTSNHSKGKPYILTCKGVFGTVPVSPVPVWMSYRTYRSVQYRYHSCRTELTVVSGTGIIDVVPNLPKCSAPVLMLYRTHRSVRYQYESLYRFRRYRYPYRTERTAVSGTGDVVPNLPKYPVPVLMSYRTHPSSGTGTSIVVVPNIPTCPVPVIPAVYVPTIYSWYFTLVPTSDFLVVFM